MSTWDSKDQDDSYDSGLATMTTTSTQWNSKLAAAKASMSTTRLPPKTRPVVVPHPDKSNDFKHPRDVCNHCRKTTCRCADYRLQQQMDFENYPIKNSTPKLENYRETESCKSYLSSEHLLPSKLNPSKRLRESPSGPLQPLSQNSRARVNIPDKYDSPMSVDGQSALSNISDKNEHFVLRTAKYDPKCYKSTSAHWNGSTPSLNSFEPGASGSSYSFCRNHNCTSCSCCDSDSFAQRQADFSHKFHSCENLSRARHKVYSDSSSCSLQKIPQKLEKQRYRSSSQDRGNYYRKFNSEDKENHPFHIARERKEARSADNSLVRGGEFWYISLHICLILWITVGVLT